MPIMRKDSGKSWLADWIYDMYNLLDQKEVVAGMDRERLLLAAMAASEGEALRPVQVQKLFFLVDEEIPKLVDGPHFDFQPHNFGPFDKDVYTVLESLNKQGLVEIYPERNWKIYKLSPSGQEKGERLLEELSVNAQDYIRKASEFVRKHSFTDLVAAIYKAYPKMRQNSVFQY